MKKILLWGTGAFYSKYIGLIKFLENEKIVSVVGVITEDNYFNMVDDYQILDRNKALFELDFDFIVVTAISKYDSIVREIFMLNSHVEGYRIIRVDLLTIEGFTFDKWQQLYKSEPTIIAYNCWGGVTYNYFGLPFFSPFINMFMAGQEEYLEFLEGNIKEQMSQELVFFKKAYQNVLDIEYPVFLLGDMRVHMNHYSDFDYAERKWYERRGRMNYDNLIIMMYTEDKTIIDRFAKLPYKKKICFVPFETDKPSILTVKPYLKRKDENAPFWEFVNGMALGRYAYYNPWDFMLEGKIKLRGK